MLKCLVFPWNIGLWEIAMAAWLSTEIFVISFSTMCKSYRIFWSHNVWFTIVIAVINYTFTIDCITMSCFLDDHESIHDLRLKQNPKMIFMLSINPPQKSHTILTFDSFKIEHQSWLFLWCILEFVWLLLNVFHLDNAWNEIEDLLHKVYKVWLPLDILNNQLSFWTFLHQLYEFHLLYWICFFN